MTNASGANLFRGVAAALLDGPANPDVGVFEVDEAAAPRLVEAVAPRVVVLTNVFRDQLDRFGEPERVAALLRAAVAALPPGAAVIANADDAPLWEAVNVRNLYVHNATFKNGIDRAPVLELIRALLAAGGMVEAGPRRLERARSGAGVLGARRGRLYA